MKKSFYVFSDGFLNRDGNTVRFRTDGKSRYVPIEDVGEILVFGEVDLTKKLLELLSKQEIIMHYFNYYGYYMGSFYPREHLNSGYMILRQAEFYSDEERRLQLARLFVEGAVRNIRQVVKYYQGRGKDVASVLEQIEATGSRLGECETVEELMAMEGMVRTEYFSAFDVIVDREGFEFEKRSRRPPQNRLNALIGFVNSLLYVSVLREIYHTHLDPRIGYLHTTNFRRFTLNLDVAEIFRPVLCDRLVFSLVGKNEVKKTDFEKGTEGTFLKERARKKVVEAWDRKLRTVVRIPGLERPVTYRRLIRLELYKLAKHLMGEKLYQPFVARW